MDQIELAKYPGIFRRGRVWQVQKKVPVDLCHLYSRDKVQRSLRTEDYKVAVGRYPGVMAEIVAGFDQKRADLARQDKVKMALDTAKLERLSRSEIDGLVWSWWEKRAGARRPNVEDDEMAETLQSVEDDLRGLAVPGPHDGDPAERLADRLLVEAGMASHPQRVGPITTVARSPAVDRRTDQYRYLRDRVRAALEIEARLAQDFLKGERSAPKDPQFNPAGGVPMKTGVGSDQPRRMKDLIADYRQDKEKKHGELWVQKRYSHIFKALEEIVGPDKPLAEIMPADCEAVRDMLRSVPSSVSKKYPKLSLRDAVEAGRVAGAPLLAPNTVASYMQNLSAMFNWDVKMWRMTRNPAAGLTEKGEAQVKRRGYEEAELRTVFAALRCETPSRYWITALSLYSGGRLNEFCQLAASDVGEVDGIAFIDFSLFDAESGLRLPDRSLKTDASDRRIPIHADLIDAGFLAFVESVRERGGGRLFPDQRLGPDGKNYGHGFSKVSVR